MNMYYVLFPFIILCLLLVVFLPVHIYGSAMYYVYILLFIFAPSCYSFLWCFPLLLRLLLPLLLLFIILQEDEDGVCGVDRPHNDRPSGKSYSYKRGKTNAAEKEKSRQYESKRDAQDAYGNKVAKMKGQYADDVLTTEEKGMAARRSARFLFNQCVILISIYV